LKCNTKPFKQKIYIRFNTNEVLSIYTCNSNAFLSADHFQQRQCENYEQVAISNRCGWLQSTTKLN